MQHFDVGTKPVPDTRNDGENLANSITEAYFEATLICSAIRSVDVVGACSHGKNLHPWGRGNLSSLALWESTAI